MREGLDRPIRQTPNPGSGIVLPPRDWDTERKALDRTWAGIAAEMHADQSVSVMRQPAH